MSGNESSAQAAAPTAAATQVSSDGSIYYQVSSALSIKAIAGTFLMNT